MSDLNAQQWSRVTIQALREREESCADSDLFCIGYLIPPVELLEIEHAGAMKPAADWKSLYLNFVEQCMVDDGMSSKDASRMREILTEL